MIPKDAGTNFLPVRFAIRFWLYIDLSIPVVALGLLGPPDALRPSAALACCNTSCAEHIKVIARLHVHGYQQIDDNFSLTRGWPKQGLVQIRPKAAAPPISGPPPLAPEAPGPGGLGGSPPRKAGGSGLGKL